ncbi:MAG: phosphoesterase PA-phosphatase, partial [Anaerotignum sp.]|nr:phosphoesterase PA-phosphatase [Anaerotignum sp.]
MKNRKNIPFFTGISCVTAFIIWTILIQTIDVQPVGVNGTAIGFAALNCWFHNLTGTNMMLYTITDWLGLIPVFVCMIFG